MPRQLTPRARWRSVARLLVHEISRLEEAIELEDVTQCVDPKTWRELEELFGNPCPEASLLRPEYERLQLLDAVLLTTFGSPSDFSLPDFSSQ